MDETSSSSSPFQRSQAAAAQGQRSVITIVPRTADDLAALARIFEATFEASGYPVEGPPALDAAAAPALVEFFSGPPAQERGGFVAVEDINARTATTAQRSGSSAQTPTSPPRRKVLGHPPLTAACGGVSRLAIDPAEQKRGVGGCLMEYVERQARQAGKTLVLGVLHKDVAAIRMYERRGWVRFGQQEGFAGRDGRLWTMYYYGLYNDAALPRKG
ncbi:acyl-CoA N-acyltransferase [Apiospora saccharicola]|uniref:Acyl-CoA N-acyltransferase n=1 Tax=Apiospora saccharicola TaxID=335842 RepID=A0ABR1TKX2_9PEZI